MLGTIGARRFLLAGDVEEEIDPSLLAGHLPPIDLLKVAHHGSRTATTDAFVAAIRPRVAVASAGAGNPYGHPARATLDRLAGAGARVYRTDRDGSVAVAFDADGMSVTTSPRPASAVTVSSAKPTRAFLCDVPIQPFLKPLSVPVDRGRWATLGYHRADDEPRPIDHRCPALPAPAIRNERRPAVGFSRGRSP
jgi:hypothetical protein